VNGVYNDDPSVTNDDAIAAGQQKGASSLAAIAAAYLFMTHVFPRTLQFGRLLQGGANKILLKVQTGKWTYSAIMVQLSTPLKTPQSGEKKASYGATEQLNTLDGRAGTSDAVNGNTRSIKSVKKRLFSGTHDQTALAAAKRFTITPQDDKILFQYGNVKTVITLGENSIGLVTTSPKKKISEQWSPYCVIDKWIPDQQLLVQIDQWCNSTNAEATIQTADEDIRLINIHTDDRNYIHYKRFSRNDQLLITQGLIFTHEDGNRRFMPGLDDAAIHTIINPGEQSTPLFFVRRLSNTNTKYEDSLTFNEDGTPGNVAYTSD